MNAIIDEPTLSSASTKLLRERTEEEFQAQYQCDRFTAALLVNRFRFVIDHVSTKLRANAFSLVIRDMMDFCATISGPPEIGWPMPAAALTNPVHWGPVPDAVRILLEEYGLERLQPGDVLVANDSYRTGKHLNDMSFIRPVFHQGRFVSALHITAHQFDIGSRTPGGLDVTARSIFEDGLVLSPMLLYRGDAPDQSVFNLIGSNTRSPNVLLPDLEVTRASLDLGEQLLVESIGKYGLDAYLGAMRYAVDGAAETMRHAVARLPDGVYLGESLMDGDGLPDSPEYAVRLRLTKLGDRMEIDFSGTSQASRSALNCSWLDIKTGVMLGLKLLLDPHSPPNSGTLRGVDIVIPPGTVLNPYPPAATMIYPAVVQAITQALLEALNGAMGEKSIASDSGSLHLHHAAGRTASGEPWGGISMTLNVTCYAAGATGAGDADSNSLLSWMNYPTSGFEVREMAAPIVIMRVESTPDSSGAGRHRGGAAQTADVLYFHGGEHHGFVSQIKHRPHGANGGGDGVLGGKWMFGAAGGAAPRPHWMPIRLDDEDHRRATPMGGLIEPGANRADTDGAYVVNDIPLAAAAGSVVRYVSNGGGGWGPAFQRPMDDVLRDVRDEYTTIEGAARDYGVVIVGDPSRDPEGLRLDLEKTATLRAQARRPEPRA